MMLESLDGQESSMINITVKREEEFVSMSIEEQLPPKTLWNVTIQAYGCEVEIVMNSTELSKLLDLITTQLTEGSNSDDIFYWCADHIIMYTGCQ